MITTTENGCLTNSTSGSKLLDFFSLGASRREPSVVSLFSDAFSENPDMALKVLFYFRDVRQGMGERDIFRMCMMNLLKDFSVLHLLHLIPEYGRWDDLFSLLGIQEDVDKKIVEITALQILEDIHHHEHGKPISLLAKWFPLEDSVKNAERKRQARILSNRIFKSHKDCRKTIVSLREYLNILERNMSSVSYENINYSHVPSRALMLHKRAFWNHDMDRYIAFVKAVSEGKAHINASAVYPYELVKRSLDYDQTAEVMWKNLPVYGDGKNSIVVVDTSASMTGDPMNIAVSLGIYFADHNTGAFKNTFLSFSSHPTIHFIDPEASLYSKVWNVMRSDWGNNTDLEAVFRVVLSFAKENNVPQKDMPENIYIVSDMEFDSCISYDGTMMETIQKMYMDAGYFLPNVIFWNVNSRSKNFPVKRDDIGVVMVSGKSPKIFDFVVSGNVDPYTFMMNIISSDRYKGIHM